MIFSVDKQIQRAKMPPRKEEFPPFMRFMNKEISESRITNPTTHKNMFRYYTRRGIFTPAARLMKAGAGQIQGAPRWMPILAKCAISTNIADPIDRETECRCAEIDCKAGISHYLTELMSPLCSDPYSVHSKIDEIAEYQKRMVAEQAEAYRERQRWAIARGWRFF